jgi:hypothetical protein
MKEIKEDGYRPALDAGSNNFKNVAVFQYCLHIKPFTTTYKRADFHFV